MYGSPLSVNARKIMLLGSGELGKEVVIEAQRLGIETIAVDRYENAPAMQVAHRSHVIDMLDPRSASGADSEGNAGSDRAGDRSDRDGRRWSSSSRKAGASSRRPAPRC